MTEFTVNQVGQGAIIFRVLSSAAAATITALRTGSTAWQQFNTDAAGTAGTAINLTQPGAAGSTIANFSWRIVA